MSPSSTPYIVIFNVKIVTKKVAKNSLVQVVKLRLVLQYENKVDE